MTEEVHPPVEEYLETIWSLEEEGAPVIQARVAKRLGRSVPTVSAMLERLESDGYLHRKPRRIILTTKGRTRAISVVRKHRLAERLLVDVIGLPWHKAHAEAGRWEHVISDEVEQYLVTLLGNPSTCPHGNPIPSMSDIKTSRKAARRTGQHDSDTAGNPRKISLEDKSYPVPLSETSIGDKITIERVTEEMEMSWESLELANRDGILPGALFTVISHKDDGTMELSGEKGAVVLSPWMSERIWVIYSVQL